MHLSSKHPFLSHVNRLVFLIGISATMMNSNALAGGKFSPVTSNITIPAEITVSENLPTGSILWKSAPVILSLTTTRDPFEGPPNITHAGVHADVQSATKAPGYSDVYSTEFPGLGVRWWGRWRGPYFPDGKVMPITTHIENDSGPLGWRWGDGARAQDVWIELVKTGSIAGGRLSNPAMSITLLFQCGYCNTGIVKLAGSTRVVTGPSCTVANSAVSVPLGAVPIQRFTGIQAASIPQQFDIVLNCKGGAPDSVLRPHVTLTDANDTSNQGTILTLSKTTTGGKPVATGLGIQILKDGIPLAYGPDSSATGNTNQWSAGTIAQGVAQFKIPLTAKYVQTAAAVTMGQANGRATFTLNYQ